MKLEKKLEEWQSHGLIDAAQRARIVAYEGQHARPLLLYALGGLGAFTIGIGIISVVAANWDGIGKLTKLALDIVLLGGLGAGLFVAQRREKTITVEVLAGICYALTLASIALLGQIYQLGSPVYQALLFWSAITFPMMTLVQGRLLALTWLAGLLSTEWACLWALGDHLQSNPAYGDAYTRELAAALVVPSWLLPLLLAHLPMFARNRPEVARAFIEALWLAFLCAGLSLACVFYVEVAPDDRVRWGQLVFVATLGAFGGLLGKLYPSVPADVRGGMLAALGIVACSAVFGVSFARGELPVVAALAQIALLACAAFVSLKLGSVRSFHGFTGLIALRVLIGYFELFGSMIDTGLGMITGGAFTLLVAWIWKRQAPVLAQKLLDQGGDHGA